MLRGTAWAVLLRWGVRGIGLVSIMILGRVLTPDDFGVLAMATIIVGFLSIVAETGAHILVIRDQEPTDELYDTAWTVSILQGVVIGLLIIAAAPLAARYFGDDRVVPVLQVLALTSVLRGFVNIGVTIARKELDFAFDFRFGLCRRLAQFAVTIPAAFLLRDYWALVIGTTVGEAIAVVASFVLHRYRPRFSLGQLRKFLTFSVHVIGIQLARYTTSRIDAFVIGGITDSARLGQYNLASEVVQIFTSEIIAPVGRALVPVYSKVLGEEGHFNQAFVSSVGAITAMVVPVGVGLSVVTSDFVLVVLGDQWDEAVIFMRWLAIYGVILGLHRAFTQAFLVSRKEKVALRLAWARFVILCPIVAGAGILHGVEAVPVAAVFATGALTPVTILVVSRVQPVTQTQIYSLLWRPLGAAGIMAWVLTVVDPVTGPPLASLAADAVLGALVYFSSLLLLWVIAGRPAGIEALVWTYGSRLFRRR